MTSTTLNHHDPQENDVLFNKLSTLFTPSTPRASPTLEDLPPLPIPHPTLPQHSRKFGSDTRFGSFVSVPVVSDPLASDVSLHKSRHSPVLPTSVGNHNSSFSFFENFVQTAKAEVDKKRHGYLDELLMHEDDPLYWIVTGDSASSPSPGKRECPLSTREYTTTGMSSLLDLDPTFFSPSIPNSSLPIVPSNSEKTAQTHVCDRPRNLRFPPSRIVPPIAITRLPSSGSGSQQDNESSPSNTREETSISTKTTTTMLKGYSSPAASTLSHVASSLHPYTRNSSPDGISDHYRAISLPEQHLHPSEPVDRVQSAHLREVVSRSFHGRGAQKGRITHGTSFNPKQYRSPFAAHVYTPPSGAPGYAGEQYDWDHGFSEELVREQMEIASKEGGCFEQEVAVDERGHQQVFEKKRTVEGSIDVSINNVMERKAGSVELLGRKEMTDTILTECLADSIRFQFSAFAGLSRKWTLAYSLDQHGISLNTLYSLCETAMILKPNQSPSVGQLLVVKDSEDGLFGIWMEKEGIRRASGYYGSGDSFLWKYNHQGDLKVFPWTGRNNYVALCEPTFLSFGGGDGNYGLYLDDTLLNGSSASCLTFSNEPLCTGSRHRPATDVIKFECVGLEVWAVGGQ